MSEFCLSMKDGNYDLFPDFSLTFSVLKWKCSGFILETRNKTDMNLGHVFYANSVTSFCLF